ncbi:MAG: hypothetical protein V1709_07050 [Planctomycetota bacterium]
MNFENDALIEGITKLTNARVNKRYPLIEKFVTKEQVKEVLDSTYLLMVELEKVKDGK